MGAGVGAGQKEEESLGAPGSRRIYLWNTDGSRRTVMRKEMRSK